MATAYTSNRNGIPDSGYHMVDDTVTDAAGVVYRCIEGGYPGKFVVTSVDAVDNVTSAMDIKTKYILALINRVHMAASTPTGLTALGTATQTETSTQANAMRTALIAHLDSAGSITVDGAHKVADTVNSGALTAVVAVDTTDTAPNQLAATILVVNGLIAAFADHGDLSGVHFHDDATAAAVTISPDPPVTLANCRTALNTILAAMDAHFLLASV